MNSSAREGHGLVARLARGAVVLPAEGDATIVEGEQASVRDRHPVGVARQIGEHRRRAGEGALGVDDPFALRAAARAIGRTRGRSLEPRVLAEELQPAAVVRGGEFFEEAAAEQSREHPHRQEEARSAARPSDRRRGRGPRRATMPCTCGWCVSADPQVCRTSVTPTCAPRCFGSAAMVRNVSAASANSRS